MTIPLLLDVDTGVDDAMAIAFATALDTHTLVGITTVAGNVPLDRATDNTLRVLEWLGCDVPVFRGMSRPLVRPLHTATSVHGNDGLGGWLAPGSIRQVESMHAPEAILSLASAHRGVLEGAFVGPLTNLAVALMLTPELATWFKHVTIMGGAFFNPGNVTKDAEFNIFVDPEAADIVARSGLATTWVGLDVTHKTSLSRSAWEAISSDAGGRAQLTKEVSRQSIVERGREQVYLHDPLAVAVVSNPDLVETQQGQVLIETGHAARGETRLAQGPGTCRVASAVQSDAFLEVFTRLNDV